ncbi:MAG: PLP-dependent aspartate aminotransferase family protein [Cyanobacteriota bacterium]
MKRSDEAIETLIVHGDHSLDPMTGALSPPLYPCSTFAFKTAQQGADLFENPMSGYFYTRISNPTIDLLRKKIAILEGAEEGLAFASGMAAIHAVIIALVKYGENIVISDTVYGGTYKLLTEVISKLGIEVRWVNFLDLDEIKQNIDLNTKFLFVETPANPTMIVYNIALLAEVSHKFNIPLIVDNTFMTPYLQRPLLLGADVVVHSATKYICGHADVVAGLVATNKSYFEKILTVLIETGGIISPFDAWLLLRGIKTLHVRMKRHSENALKMALFLENHKMVKRVLYPGLQSHPQYNLSKSQCLDFGGIIAFEINGDIEECKIVLDNLNVFTLAISLGDIDSLIQHPLTMTHSSYSKEMLKKAGITPSMIRLSIGLENIEDLIKDIDQALNKAYTLVKK